MKKEIFEALKTKFDGVQDAILNRIAEKLAKTVTDTNGVTTAVEGVTFQQILESYGDSRATEATQTAVTNYEKKHNLKEGVKAETKPEGGADPQQGGQPAGQAEEMPAWAKKLAEQNEALANKLAGIETEKVSKTRATLFTSVIESAPEKLRNRYTKDFNRMTFKDDEEFNTWLEEAKTDITDFVNDLSVAGATFSSPKKGGSANEEKPSAEVEARVKKREAETVAPAIKGLPETK